MNALQYLRDIPVVFINVESSVKKREQFMRGNGQLFDTIYRLPASPIVDVAQEAHEWRSLVSETKANRDDLGMFTKVNVFLAKDKTLERESKQHEYAATFSLYRSVMAALLFFLNNTHWDRMMLMEDDALPRLQLLSQIGPPPSDADLIVWGGAISMGAHNYDDTLFIQKKAAAWKPIKNPRNRYIATAYEMTRKGALEQFRALQEHPHAVDCSWWYTMASVTSVALSPVGFVQYGQSDRINTVKNGRYER